MSCHGQQSWVQMVCLSTISFPISIHSLLSCYYATRRPTKYRPVAIKERRMHRNIHRTLQEIHIHSKAIAKRVCTIHSCSKRVCLSPKRPNARREAWNLQTGRGMRKLPALAVLASEHSQSIREGLSYSPDSGLVIGRRPE